MSIIGRIIGLLLVVAFAFIATWCIANPAEAEAEWNKIFNKTPQQEQPDKPDDPTPDNPTPDDPSEGYNLDGIWYYTIPESEDIEFMEFQGTKFRFRFGFISNNKIYISNDLKDDSEWLEGYAEETDDTYSIIFDSGDAVITIATINKQTNKVDNFEYETAAEMTKVTDFEIHEHTFGEEYVFQEPTCIEVGFTAHRCNVCGVRHLFNVLPATGIHIEDVRVITEATCTSEGQREIYCQDCLEVLRTETIPAKGHSYSLGLCETCGIRNPITHYEVLTGQPWTGYDDSFLNRCIIESIFESGAKFRNMDNHEEIYTIQKYEQSTITTMKITDPQGYVLDFGSQNIAVSFFYDGDGLIGLWANGERLEPNTSFMGFYTGNNGRLCFNLFGNAQLEYFETDNHYFCNGTCSMCGEKDPNFVCTEHSFTTGEYGGVCEICGYTITCHHENQYVGYSEAATCESEGYELYFCSDENCICHDYYAIKRATLPALGHDYVDGVCSRCHEEVALTWKLNETLNLITPPVTQTTQFNINFTSNNQSFVGLYIIQHPADNNMRYLVDVDDTLSSTIVYIDDRKWEDLDRSDTSAYRTITFETAPSGDLLAWLQANATPQA